MTKNPTENQLQTAPPPADRPTARAAIWRAGSKGLDEPGSGSGRGHRDKRDKSRKSSCSRPLFLSRPPLLECSFMLLSRFRFFSLPYFFFSFRFCDLRSLFPPFLMTFFIIYKMPSTVFIHLLYFRHLLLSPTAIKVFLDLIQCLNYKPRGLRLIAN